MLCQMVLLHILSLQKIKKQQSNNNIGNKQTVFLERYVANLYNLLGIGDIVIELFSISCFSTYLSKFSLIDTSFVKSVSQKFLLSLQKNQHNSRTYFTHFQHTFFAFLSLSD